MPVLTIAKGLPGCGKTTWAIQEVKNKKSETVIVCRDNIREMLAGSHENYKFKGASEDLITKMQKVFIEEAYNNGWNCIVADTNLALGSSIEQYAKGLGFTVRIKDFFEEFCKEFNYNKDYFGMKAFYHRCSTLNLTRSKIVEDDVIFGMLEKYYYSTLTIPVNDPVLEHAVIFDIDGTLASHTGIRSPFDESKVLLDEPNLDVIEMVKVEREFHNRKIIIMSGRTDGCREDTMKWLAKYQIQYDHLYMRRSGDQRSDDIVKYELYMENVQNAYYIHKVYDDRQKVCDMWRTALNFRVFQVAPGNF